MMKSFFVTLTLCLLFLFVVIAGMAAYRFIDSLPPVAWPILGLVFVFVFVLLWAVIHAEMYPDQNDESYRP